MSIFNRTSLMESVDDVNVEPYEGHIAPTMESVIELGAELEEGVYKLNTSLYVADLLLEQRAQAGEDVEALTEAAVGDFFGKMAKKFKEIWGKIKTFFANIFKKIEAFISSGKHFIKTYEKSIRDAANNKDAKWVEYAEHEDYDEIEKLISTYNKFVENTVNTLKDRKADVVKVTDLAHGEDYESTEQTTCSKLPGAPNTYAEAKEVVNKITKGKKTGEKKTLDKTTLLKMIDVIKNYVNNGVKNAKKEANDMDKLCKNCISSIEQLKNSVKDANNTQMNEISKYCTEMSKAISFAQWFSGKTVSGYSKRYQHSLAVVKAFTSANSKMIVRKANESVETYEAGSDSLLESILEAF